MGRSTFEAELPPVLRVKKPLRGARELRRLSVLIPVYNEAATITELLSRLTSVQFPVELEIVLVNDGSTDGTAEVLDRYAADPGFVVVHQSPNRGKAAAIRRAVECATGDIFVIQDADLEYDPADLPRLLEPILAGDADVVYGSRFSGGSGLRGRAAGMSLHHTLGNRLLTWLTNLLFGTELSDMETCYKMALGSIYRSFVIERSRFELEPEITAKILNQGCAVTEVPISFHARTREEGKKISWIDGFGAVLTLLRYRFQRTTVRSSIPLTLPESES